MGKLEFSIDGEILQALAKSDPRLGRLIARVGGYSLELREDYFPSLVRSIIGQQLSIGAARTIWDRTMDLCGDLCPERILGIPEERLRSIGLSANKARFIQDLSRKVSAGELDLEVLRDLPNAVVLQRLTSIRGIGAWTAEMFLIFSLGRLDILSLKDAGLRRAVQWLYAMKKSPSDRTMISHGKKWAPYQSVASLYLWEAINRGLIKGEPPGEER